MEKLILKCGRFMPPAAGDGESRVRLMEAYLAKLSEELEFLVGELDRALADLEEAVTEGDGLTVASVADADSEEGSV